MDYDGLVRGVLASLELLYEDGSLVPLDSLQILTVVTRLEKAAGVSIASTALTPEAFESCDAIARLLETDAS